MKLTSSSTARRRTASAPLRSFGGPQMPSPVRRIAPNPRRCTEISPPNETSPAVFAESSFLFMIASKILPFSISHSDARYPNARRASLGERSDSLCRSSSHPAHLPRWGSHEFRPDWIANTLAKNCVDRSKISLFQRPTAYFRDSCKLFWTTCAPERDANAWLIEQPADRQMDHTLAKVLASICIQF